MRKPALIIGALLVLFMFAQCSKAQDKVEIFGGYSFVRAPVASESQASIPCTITGCPLVFGPARANGNGWEATGAVKVHKWVSIAADFGGYYGSSLPGNFRLNTYMIGPQVSIPLGRISPFAHVLFGAAHETAPTVSATAFSYVFGGGLDLKLNRFASVRIVQVDLMVTGFGAGQAVPRVSSGFVLHF